MTSMVWIKTLHKLSKINRVFFHLNLWLNGCELSPLAHIPDSVVFAHSSGVIIGGPSEIGERCTIYAPCVIGVYKGEYPTIGDDCRIGAYSLIAGRVKLADNTIIKPYSNIIEVQSR